MQIKMIQHYCGYLNGNADFWPDEVKAVPNDVTEEAAKELIDRKYAVDATPPDNMTRTGQAMEETAKVMRGKK